MACSICLHDFDKTRRGQCASCARTILYTPQLQQVVALLQKESSHSHVEAIVRSGNDGVLASLPQSADFDTIARGVKTDGFHKQQDRYKLHSARLSSILEKADELKRRMIGYRDEIEARKRSNLQQAAELAKKRTELDQYRTAALEPAESAVRKLKQRVQRLSQRSADAKANLCFSVGSLMGVRQENDVRRRLTGRVMLAGLIVPDLREISGPITEAVVTASALHFDSEKAINLVNASLDNITRLVTIWTHYLTISMPAEVIAARNDFPHPGILPEKSSYRGSDIPYPGHSSQHTSPTTSRIITEAQSLPRPRVLHLDRPLSRLAKEEPKAFGLFVEGITLLAWDVAWLCRSQGIISINTFDDVCDIGRNLWLLYRAAELRVQESHQAEQTPRSKATARESQFGKLTHGAVTHSLSGHEGAAIFQTWRLAQPQHLTDKLRAFLLGEMTKAEWDVLSDKDFDDNQDEVAVLVGGDRSRRSNQDGAMSVMSVAPFDKSGGLRPEKGWMKVRDRGSDG